MIYELPIYDISHVLNFELVAHEGQLSPNGAILGSVGSKQNQIEAADHLMLNVHHLTDLNLVKKIF